MKIQDFPIVKITGFYIIGLLIEYYFKIGLTYSVIIQLVTLITFFASFYYSDKNFSQTNVFGVSLYFLFLSIGITNNSLHDERIHKNHYIHLSNLNEKHNLIIITKEKLKGTSKKDRYIAEIQNIDGKKITGKIILIIKKTNNNFRLISGSKVLVHDFLKLTQKPNNPNQFDYSTYLKNKNIYAQVFTNASSIKVNPKPVKSIRYYTEKFRETIITNLKKNGFPERELAVINALILGQQQEISKDIIKDYQYAGAVHILSVSGLHVGFILLFITLLLKPIPKTKVGKTTRFLITLFLLWAFAFIAGLAPSVIRSTVMFSFIAFGNYLNRESNIFNTAIASMFIILIFEPYILFDIGFQLSYIAVFSILIIEPLLAKIWKPKNKYINIFWKITTVSFAAQIGTLPLSLYYFHQIPGLFFITNLVILPLLEFVIMPLGSLITLLAYFDCIPHIIIQIVANSIKGMNHIINIIASLDRFVIKEIPFTHVMVILSYLFLLLFLSWFYKPNFKRLTMSLIVLLLIQSTLLYTNWNAKKNKSFIVFNTKNNSIIGEIKNQEITIYSRQNIKKDTYEENMLNSFCTANFYKIKPFKKEKNCYYFKGSKILLIDSTISIPKNKTIDILILTQSPKLNLDRLLSSLKPKQVVADATNYKNYIDLWKSTCIKRKIPFHSTYEKGFYKID